MSEYTKFLVVAMTMLLTAAFAQDAVAGAISSGGIHEDLDLPGAKEVGNGVTDGPLCGVDFGNGVVDDAGCE